MSFQEKVTAICTELKLKLKKINEDSVKQKLITRYDERLRFELLNFLHFNPAATVVEHKLNTKALVVTKDLREDLNKALVDALILFDAQIKLKKFIALLIKTVSKDLFKNPFIKKLRKNETINNLLQKIVPSDSIATYIDEPVGFLCSIIVYDNNNFKEVFDYFMITKSLDLNEVITFLCCEIINSYHQNLFSYLEYVLPHAAKYDQSKSFYQNITKIGHADPTVENDNNNNKSLQKSSLLPFSLLHLALLNREKSTLDLILSKEFNYNIKEALVDSKLPHYYFIFDYFLSGKEKIERRWSDDTVIYYFEKLSKDAFSDLPLDDMRKLGSKLIQEKLIKTFIFLIVNDWLQLERLTSLPQVQYKISSKEANIKCNFLSFTRLASLLCEITDPASFIDLYNALQKKNLLTPADSVNLLIYCTANFKLYAAMHLVNLNIDFYFKHQKIISAFDVALMGGYVEIISRMLAVQEPHMSNLVEAIHFTINKLNKLLIESMSAQNKKLIAMQQNNHTSILEMLFTIYFKQNFPSPQVLEILGLNNEQNFMSYFFAVMTLFNEADDSKLSAILECSPLSEKRFIPNGLFVAKLSDFNDIRKLSIIMPHTTFENILNNDLLQLVEHIFLWTQKSNQHFEFIKSFLNTLKDLKQQQSFDPKQSVFALLFVRVLNAIHRYSGENHDSLRATLSLYLPSNMITSTKKYKPFNSTQLEESSVDAATNLKELALLLIELNINFETPVHIIDDIESSPFVYVCICNLIDIVEHILANNISLTNSYSQYSLILAAHLGHFNVVKVLLKYDETNFYFNTDTLSNSLSISVQNNHLEIFELLLTHLSRRYQVGEPLNKENIPSQLLSLLKETYLEMGSNQSPPRLRLENYIPDPVLEKLKRYDKPASAVSDTDIPTALAKLPSNKKWRYFSFFDNGQTCYARLEEKDYCDLEKRDQGKQMEYVFNSNNEQQRFGPRFKRLNNDTVKMRFTGHLRKVRIFFEKEKTLGTNIEENFSVFTAKQYLKKH